MIPLMRNLETSVMTSEPLNEASYIQTSKQGEQGESKNVSLKPDRLDVAMYRTRFPGHKFVMRRA